MSEAEKKKLPKSFNKLIQESEKPVLVDFFATWSNPCKTVEQIIKKLAKEYKGRILTIRIDIDAKRHVQSRYHIVKVPTVMLFWKGEELMRVTGALTYEQYREQIEQKIPKD
jgi:thioredoxin